MKIAKIKERIEKAITKAKERKNEKEWERIRKQDKETILAMRVKMCFDRGMTVEETAKTCDMKESQVKYMYWFIKNDFIDWTGCDFTTVSI